MKYILHNNSTNNSRKPLYYYDKSYKILRLWQNGDSYFSIAEFFIMKMYRRAGLVKLVAMEVGRKTQVFGS